MDVGSAVADIGTPSVTPVKAGPNFQFIVPQLLKGAVVPFLGAGASRFHQGLIDNDPCPPSAVELALQLANTAQFPDNKPDYERYRQDLARVASYFEHVEVDRYGLLEVLRPIFDRDYKPNGLHNLLAKVARRTPLLIITTNYDDMIERAFAAQPEPLPYHLVVTAIEDEQVKYQRPGSNQLEIVDPMTLKISLEDVSIIYKMHGSINRADAEADHYVITEEDYVRFLSNMVGGCMVPVAINALLQERRFLFLGYSLRDWNFRVMLEMLWSCTEPSCANNGARRRRGGEDTRKSWSIQQDPDEIERKLWKQKRIDIYDLDLDHFTRMLTSYVDQAVSESFKQAS